MGGKERKGSTKGERGASTQQIVRQGGSGGRGSRPVEETKNGSSRWGVWSI